MEKVEKNNAQKKIEMTKKSEKEAIENQKKVFITMA